MDDILAALSPETIQQTESVLSRDTSTSSLESLVSPGEITTYEDAAAYRNAIETASQRLWSAGPLGMVRS